MGYPKYPVYDRCGKVAAFMYFNAVHLLLDAAVCQAL